MLCSKTIVVASWVTFGSLSQSMHCGIPVFLVFSLFVPEEFLETEVTVYVWLG